MQNISCIEDFFYKIRRCLVSVLKISNQCTTHLVDRFQILIYDLLSNDFFKVILNILNEI